MQLILIKQHKGLGHRCLAMPMMPETIECSTCEREDGFPIGWLIGICWKHEIRLLAESLLNPAMHEGAQGGPPGQLCLSLLHPSTEIRFMSPGRHMQNDVYAVVRHTIQTCEELGDAGMESHAGQVFTCVGALALADSLHLLDRDLLCWWYASNS